VVGAHEGIGHDLLGLHVPQVDDGDAGVRLVVDEQVLAVVVGVGLRQGRMMGVAPGEVAAFHATLGQHLVGLLGPGAPALPGLGREHTDHLQESHGGDPDDLDLPGLAP
jgi:hypothetical protein